MAQPDAERLMARAVELARRASGQTHPNPLVGALIVEDGEIVAEGWHRAAGLPHAEVEAISDLGRAPKDGATLYVTLEPCSTHGRTGACTHAILKAGIQKVVIGATDPNPAHAGAGLQILRDAGVEVIEGVLADVCSDLNLIFNHWILQQQPLIALKIATTLDGKFAASNGASKWVTGEIARADVMRWRQYFPAIAVSASTVLADNPSLTARFGDVVNCPQRFILDSSLKTVSEVGRLNVFTDQFRSKTTLVCSDAADVDLKRLVHERGIALWELPSIDGHLDFNQFRKRLVEFEINGLYLEAGPSLTTALLESGQVDYLFHYIAPKYLCDAESFGIGSERSTQSMDASIRLKEVKHFSFGDDFLVCGHV